MTVIELIELLQRQPPDADVVLWNPPECSPAADDEGAPLPLAHCWQCYPGVYVVDKMIDGLTAPIPEAWRLGVWGEK
jgi:hypothetical protein